MLFFAYDEHIQHLTIAGKVNLELQVCTSNTQIVINRILIQL
jgi:hypothetical protein